MVKQELLYVQITKKITDYIIFDASCVHVACFFIFMYPIFHTFFNERKRKDIVFMKICVYGAASPTIDPCFIKTVEKMGKLMAERGHSLVFGAGGNGLMGAAARGVTAGGGKILGIIPKFFKDEVIEEIYDKCDELVFTENMRERKQLMEDNADAFIIVPGGIGTFEEFFEILTLKQLCRHNKPIAVYNINGYYNELETMIKASISKNFIKENCSSLYRITDDIDEIFNYIENDKLKIKNIKELKDG